jgi:hypothetical protein
VVASALASVGTDALIASGFASGGSATDAPAGPTITTATPGHIAARVATLSTPVATATPVEANPASPVAAPTLGHPATTPDSPQPTAQHATASATGTAAKTGEPPTPASTIPAVPYAAMATTTAAVTRRLRP